MMSQPERSTDSSGNLIPESQDFASYSSLSGDAVHVELLGRLTVFIQPALLVVIYLVTYDAIAQYEGWIDVIDRVFYILLVVLACHCIWRLIHAVLFVRRYRYRFDADGVHVLSGVFVREHSTVPRNRIQHVNLVQGVMQRQSDLATLTFMTAGTTGVGTSVRHIPIELANRIKKEIVEDANAVSPP